MIDEKDKEDLAQKSFYIEHLYNGWASYYEEQFMEEYNYIAPQEVFNAVAKGSNVQKQRFQVLDVGVGTGLLSAHFRQASQSAILTGVDISEEMLLKCKEKGIMNFLGRVDFQIEGLPFKDSSFDAVVSSGVFELLKKPELVIEEMARVAKPGGIVAFTSLLNPKDEPKNLFGILKSIFSFSSSVRPEDGMAHERDLLVGALEKARTPVICEKRFVAYRRGLGDTVYNLYTGRKLA